jgi:hypothetical protein
MWCRYAVDREPDRGYEHARARLATVFLQQDLEELDGATKLSSVAVTRSGFEPGPVHPLEPHHWFWAMFYEPRVRLSWSEESRS